MARTPQQRLMRPQQGWKAFAAAVEASGDRRRRGKGSQLHLVPKDASAFAVAPRCSVIRQGGAGERCRCPAVRGASRCYWHGGLLEVPAHPGNRKQLEKYHARIARAAARTQTYLLPREARQQAALHYRGAGRDWHAILAGAQAYLQDDGGLAFRRWMQEHEERWNKTQAGKPPKTLRK